MVRLRTRIFGKQARPCMQCKMYASYSIYTRMSIVGTIEQHNTHR